MARQMGTMGFQSGHYTIDAISMVEDQEKDVLNSGGCYVVLDIKNAFNFVN